MEKLLKTSSKCHVKTHNNFTATFLLQRTLGSFLLSNQRQCNNVVKASTKLCAMFQNICNTGL